MTMKERERERRPDEYAEGEKKIRDMKVMGERRGKR